MSRVTELEKALTTLFRKGTEVGYTETEIDEFLENIDYHALLQAVWNKAETVYAQVYVPLRLFFTLSCKVIKNALGNGLRRSIVEHDSIQTDVHFFRDQRNRFKFRIALTLFNLNDGSGTHIKPFC